MQPSLWKKDTENSAGGGSEESEKGTRTCCCTSQQQGGMRIMPCFVIDKMGFRWKV